MSVDTLLVPNSVSIEEKSKNRAIITLEPFEPGFGHTLGNALRRVLLSSLPGCAVTKVKIEGILHEYESLEGIHEDTEVILLNLKTAAFAIHGDEEEVTLTLKKQGPGPVCLGDIDLSHNVELINPEHVIAHINTDRAFNMTLTIAKGRGEQLAAARTHEEETEIGALYLDAVFSPVRRVGYKVDPARMGQRVDLDKIIIDLKTNGTISPQDAIRESALMLQDQFIIFRDINRIDPTTEPEEVHHFEPILLESIDILELGHRAASRLKAEKIHFIGDLVTKTEDELLQTPSLGKKSLAEIKEALSSYSLVLATPLAHWPPPTLKYPEVEETSEE